MNLENQQKILNDLENKFNKLVNGIVEVRNFDETGAVTVRAPVGYEFKKISVEWDLCTSGVVWWKMIRGLSDTKECLVTYLKTAKESFVMKKHSHDQHEVCICTKGFSEFKSHDIVLKAGQIIEMQPFEVHDWVLHPYSECLVVWQPKK